MNKIKIVGVLIFIFSIILAILFNYTSKQNILHSKLIKTIKDQKDITQDISKNIFYIYKNSDNDTKNLNNSIKTYLNTMNDKEKKTTKG
jgi:hypothetical protein